MKRYLILTLVILGLVLVLPVVNLVVGGPAHRLGSPADPEAAQLATILSKKCGHCHADNGEHPFYAKLPVARGVIENDIRSASTHLDLAEAFADGEKGTLPAPALVKTEYVIEDGSMPPMRYRLLHWGSRLTREDKERLSAWIRSQWDATFAAADTSPEHRHDPIQPLPVTVEVDAAKVAVGEKLFHDARLSADDTIACATCHALDKGGTDQQRFSTGIAGRTGDINSPTVFNSSLQFHQFWDGRAANLEAQANGPVNNPIEMGANWPMVVAKLEKDAAFAKEFGAVYPDGIRSENIVNAIAEFERSLVTPNSPFDRYLRGERDAISPEAAEGHRLFKDVGCAMCHVGSALGGRSFERMGLAQDYFAMRGNPGKADNGRFNVTGRDEDLHFFKVPTLRNVAVTYPYFHDGSVNELRNAVEIMGRVQRDRQLSDFEIDRIVAFLRSLTGEYRGKPLG